eukprot:TRINITY_DN10451_c0_g1_i1.p1 TRINITY_DN10451_c0_g1~~TRINITY_DN10451_c0_g1_i1.p1  ORF type:complete len:158 (-),score=32.28 TRINITY_DN10451_c0_g1_i1:8-481(-)
MRIFCMVGIFCLTVCYGSPLPKGLTLSQFRQEGRSLEDKLEGESVIVSRSYAKIRHQGKKGFTELVHHAGPGNVEMTYETEVETKKILASIDAINNAIIGEGSSTKDSDTVEESEARKSASSNIFSKPLGPVIWLKLCFFLLLKSKERSVFSVKINN